MAFSQEEIDKTTDALEKILRDQFKPVVEKLSASDKKARARCSEIEASLDTFQQRQRDNEAKIESQQKEISKLKESLATSQNLLKKLQKENKQLQENKCEKCRLRSTEDPIPGPSGHSATIPDAPDPQPAIAPKRMDLMEVDTPVRTDTESRQTTTNPVKPSKPTSKHKEPLTSPKRATTQPVQFVDPRKPPITLNKTPIERIGEIKGTNSTGSSPNLAFFRRQLAPISTPSPQPGPSSLPRPSPSSKTGTLPNFELITIDSDSDD